MANNVTGVTEAMKWLADIVVEETNTIATNIHDDAKAHTPVGPGPHQHMIDHWHLHLIDKCGDTAIVSNDSDHAIFVHNGTNDTRPNPMLSNAVDKEMNKR